MTPSDPPGSAPGHRPDRPWDAVSRAAMRPRILGVPLNVAGSLVVMGMGIYATVIATTGRTVGEVAVVGVAGTIATGLAAALAWTVIWTPSSRRAFEAFVWLGEHDVERFRATSGGRYPATMPGMKRYVEQEPERPDDRWIRAELLAASGDLAGSRAMAERIPADEPAGRAERAVALAYVDWLSGGLGDPGEARAAVAAFPPTDEEPRMVAAVALAITEVRHLIARNDPDPARPLREVRKLLGRRADGVLLAGGRRIAPSYLRASALYIVAGVVVVRVFFS